MLFVNMKACGLLSVWLFIISGCTQFCDDWAQALTGGDPTNPVFIRQIIDSFKLKVFDL